MKMFAKQSLRSPVTTTLLVLLLAFSIAASSIGFTAWTGATGQAEGIEEQYTTIAVPKGTNLEKSSDYGGFEIEDGNYIYSDGTKYVSPASAEATAKESEYYVASDNRILLSAEVAGSSPVSSGTVDPLRYSYTLDLYPYQMSVLALRCTGVGEATAWHFAGYEGHTAEFELIDAVSRIDAYDLPPYDSEIVLASRMFTADGECPFEVGKTYLVRGRYWDFDVYCASSDGEEVVRKRDTSGQLTKRMLLMDPEYPILNNPDYPNCSVDTKTFSETGLKYYCTPEDCWPYFAEYTGSWEAYLESEAGRVWKEEIIPDCERNHASAPVILTDNVESIYYFNTGVAKIMEGSVFEDADYVNGNAVCLVSASYAAVNGLAVGDTINLDFHHTGYAQETYPVLQLTGRVGLTIVRYPLSDSTRINVQKDYTIVGIYTAPEWEAGSQSFHADTIFVPKASVPDAESYNGAVVTLLNCVIIENGSAEAFEAHMAENGKGGAYVYYDQGYAEAAASVQTMIENAMRLMLVGVAMFALASLLFLLLFARRTTTVMRSMRLLGVPKKQTWLEGARALTAQELAAVILGNLLAVILYDIITNSLLSGTPALSPTALILCGIVQLFVLLCVGLMWLGSLAGRNLMQKQGGFKWNRTKAASCGA